MKDLEKFEKMMDCKEIKKVEKVLSRAADDGMPFPEVTLPPERENEPEELEEAIGHLPVALQFGIMFLVDCDVYPDEDGNLQEITDPEKLEDCYAEIKGLIRDHSKSPEQADRAIAFLMNPS